MAVTMRKLFVVLALLAAPSIYAQGPGSRFSAPGPPAQVVTVAKSGGGFTTICGATCTSTTADCAAGSAMASITDASSTKPYVIKVAAGVYDECVAVKDKTDISFAFAPGAYVWPSSTSITGGVFRIAPSGNTTDVVRVRVFGGSFRNNSTATDAGCQIGQEGGTGAAAEWDSFLMEHTECLGRSRGLAIAGHETAAAADVPRLILRDVRAVSASTGVFSEGNYVGEIDVDSTVWPGYCSPAAGVLSGTVGPTGNTTTAAHLNTGPSGNNIAFVPRTLTLASGTCAAGATKTIATYNGSTKVVAWSGALAFTPDTTCTWSVSAPPMSSQAPCTDVQWFDQATTAVGVPGFQFYVDSTTPNPATNTFLDINLRGRTYITSDVAAGFNHGGIRWSGFPAESVSVSVNTESHQLYNGIGDGALYGFLVDVDPADANKAISLSGHFIGRNTGDTAISIYGTAAQATGDQVGHISLKDVTYDNTATVGSFAASVVDFAFNDDVFGTLSGANVVSLQNNGQIKYDTRPSDPNTDLKPTQTWASPQKTMGTLGHTDPLWSANMSPAWASGDLICSLVHTPNGTQVFSKAMINVATAEAAKVCSVCVYGYDSDGATAETSILSFDNLDCANTGVKTASAGDAFALAPGKWWMCVGSNAAGTLVLKGAPAGVRGTTVVGRLGTGGATCPATIDTSAMTAWANVVPEAVLLP